MPRFKSSDGEKMEPVTVYLTVSIKAKLEAIANENGRSTSSEAARRVKLSIESEMKGDGAKVD